MGLKPALAARVDVAISSGAVRAFVESSKGRKVDDSILCGEKTCDTIGIHLQYIPPVLSTCPLHTNSGCGKERRILIGPW